MSNQPTTDGGASHWLYLAALLALLVDTAVVSAGTDNTDRSCPPSLWYNLGGI